MNPESFAFLLHEEEQYHQLESSLSPFDAFVKTSARPLVQRQTGQLSLTSER